MIVVLRSVIDYNALQLLCINHIPSILVLQRDVEAEDRTVHVEVSLLAVAPLQCIDNYKLEEEDPGVFSDGDDRIDKWIPRREWPDKLLPVRQTAPEPQTEQTNQAFIDHLMQQHHMNVQVLESMGFDPCGEYKRAKAQNILARVREGNVTCALCKAKLSSTKSLRSHIRSRHLEESQQQFKCQQCSVACCGAHALKVHMRVHSAAGRPHLLQLEWSTLVEPQPTSKRI